MPVVKVKSRLLFQAMGQTFTEKEFDQLCFDFGIELDDVSKDVGGNGLENEIYHIDIPANRYDLLCLEGLVRALGVFRSEKSPPVFRAIHPASATQVASTRVTVRAETAQIRPFIACAVLRDLSLDENSYQSCLDLQDQLHRNLGRRRRLVSIGTHNLDSVCGPFTYEALVPEKIRFQNLFADREMDGREMMEWFRTDPAGKHIKEYTDIIYNSPVYPVLYDKNRNVLSMPPLINGVISKIGPKTKNMFIEVTGTDMTKTKIVLNTIIAMFSCYCACPDSAEVVEVCYDEPIVPGGQSKSVSKMITPDLNTWEAKADVDVVQSTIGADIDADALSGLCDRMQLGPASLSSDKKTLFVTVPVTRSDIMHEVDIIEDVAIAYGFNNIARTVPASHQMGKELPLNLLTDLLRQEVSRLGFLEILSLGLCSKDENFNNLNRVDNGSAVKLSNPKSVEFEVVRTSLLPGILKTLKENLNQKFSGEGLKLFEVSDVVLRETKQNDTDCRNERRLVALHAGMISSFETLHGLIDRVMQVLSVAPAIEYAPDAAESEFVKSQIENKAIIGTYKVVEHAEPLYLRGGVLMWKRNGNQAFEFLGTFGVVHPTVLNKFQIGFPTTVLEINIEPFVIE